MRKAQLGRGQIDLHSQEILLDQVALLLSKMVENKLVSEVVMWWKTKYLLQRKQTSRKSYSGSRQISFFLAYTEFLLA